MARVQIVGGKFQDCAGNPLANGYIEFRPSGDEQGQAPLSQIAGGITVKVNLDSTGNVPASPAAYLWPNDAENPGNSFYAVVVYTAKGQRAYSGNFQILSTPDPFDLSAWVPWNPNASQGGSGDRNTPKIFNGTYLGWVLNGFSFTIPTPGVLGFTIGAGSAVVQGNYVSAAQYTQTGLTNNFIYDLWLNTDGTYTVAALPADDYTNAPLYPDKLHIVRVQTAISPYNGEPSVTGIFPTAATYPIEKVTVEQSLNIKDFVNNFFWVPDNVVDWQPSTDYATGDIFITPVGRRIYQCNLPGTSGSTEPTATYGSPANQFLVQDGTEFCAFFGLDWGQGSFRWAKNNGIEQYFQNLGLRLVCKWMTAYPNPTDGVATDMILSHIKKQFLTVAHTRQNSFDYERGQIIIVPQSAAGFYWQCQTGGTSASSSPFSGSYSIGSVVTDGGAQFKAVYQYNNLDSKGPDWVWLDVLQDWETFKYPDSHDSYASTFATLIAIYIQSTGNVSWLSETSPQAGLSYYDVLKNIVTASLTSQMYSDTVKLTNTFQNQVAPFPPFNGTYNISYLEDNCESYEGLVNMTYIAGLQGDSAFATTCNQAAVDIANQIFATFYGTSNKGNSFFLYYYPQDPGYTWDAEDAKPSGTLNYYPNLQPNFWPELCGLPYKNDIFYSARNWVVSKWTSYWADPSKDTAFPDLHLAVAACTMWKKPEIAEAVMRICETFTIPYNAAGNMSIDEFARYLFCKNQLVPNINLTSIDQTGLVFASDPLNVIALPSLPNNDVVASGTYAANFGDFVLAATAGGDVTVNLPNALDGKNKSSIFVSKYGSDGNSVTCTDGAGFTRTLTSDGNAFTFRASSGVWTVTSAVA